MDLYEFGVEEAGDRFRLMEAVKELQRGGATQVERFTDGATQTERFTRTVRSYNEAELQRSTGSRARRPSGATTRWSYKGRQAHTHGNLQRKIC